VRLDRFTQSFQESIADAQSLALGKEHQFIEPIHLMLALLNQNGNSIISLLKSADIDVRTFRQKLEQALSTLAKVSDSLGDVQLSTASGRMLNLCDKHAQKNV
jgi:ATP-dependent Clp protease ATP-binding subunit ClpB